MNNIHINTYHAIWHDLKGKEQKLKTNIFTLLQNPQSIPQHSDYVQTVQKLIEELSEVEGQIQTLENTFTSLFPAIPNPLQYERMTLLDEMREEKQQGDENEEK